MSVVASGPEVICPVDCEGPAQSVPSVQQVDLTPQIHQSVGAGRAGQQDHPPDLCPDFPQGFEPAALGVFEAGALVCHDAVKGPPSDVGLAIGHQPWEVVPVDDINVRLLIECPFPLTRCAHHDGDVQAPQVVPFMGLTCPGVSGYALGRDHQGLVDFDVFVLESLDGCEGCDGLAQSHVQEEGGVPVVDDELGSPVLVCVRVVFHLWWLFALSSCSQSAIKRKSARAWELPMM